jgi:SAM-dependent methyltransferase
MKDVTVDLGNPSLYAEPDSKFYRFKRKLTMNTVLKKIRKQVNHKQAFSLLEIGTGSGFTMTFLETEFPKATLTGIEYDPRLVKLTQSKVKSARVIQGNAENFDLGGEKFDIIVSLQVIEHLYHPELMIASVKKHLKPNGVFIFTTPNLGCYSARVMKDKWHGYREDHVSLKTNDEWVSLTLENGFDELYSGSTFFTGIPLLNKLPFGIINWTLLLFIGSMRWKQGESFIGVFKNSNK